MLETTYHKVVKITHIERSFCFVGLIVRFIGMNLFVRIQSLA